MRHQLPATINDRGSRAALRLDIGFLITVIESAYQESTSFERLPEIVAVPASGHKEGSSQAQHLVLVPRLSLKLSPRRELARCSKEGLVAPVHAMAGLYHGLNLRSVGLPWHGFHCRLEKSMKAASPEVCTMSADSH